MRNKHPGTCYRCGEMVDIGAGFFERVGQDQRQKYGQLVAGQSFLVQHAACQKKHFQTDHHYLMETSYE